MNEAIQINGPRPVYLSNLAAVYLKLKRYDLVEETATSALEQDPWMIEALYRRGIARKETCQFSAAQMDFVRILGKDPDSVKVNAELFDIQALLGYGTSTPETSDDSDPSPKGAVVLQLSLAHEVFFYGIFAHTLAALRARTTLHVARNATQALEALAAPDLSAVFVTDQESPSRSTGRLRRHRAMFSSFIAPPKFATFFRDAWGLPWKMEAYHRANFAPNRTHDTVKGNPSMLPSYSMKAAHLKKISAGGAARTGAGRVGYVDDVNGEQGSTNAVLAMLGVLDGLESSGSDGVARFVLHLALDQTFDVHLGTQELLEALDTLTTLSIAHTAVDALPFLASPALGGVFITDTCITWHKHAALLAHLVAAPETDTFFRDGWGLSWTRSAYHRVTFALNRDTVLAAACSMKTVQLSGIPAAAALYREPGARATEAPVVFAEVGAGHLGYIGDINAEDVSQAVVLAMFGLELQ
ncbi:hypothetical protein B0H17DRAFT_1195671 [Mycena rosella]|uniref:Uncharacterized protein n=1 Tax=Mycena rosella TaxID=1033263 RepID=A0AAD7GLN4_MYCRO|nr:hypothetical protein B0H17DRAFT_1195671 [Mycena rosella]